MNLKRVHNIHSNSSPLACFCFSTGCLVSTFPSCDLAILRAVRNLLALTTSLERRFWMGVAFGTDQMFVDAVLQGGYAGVQGHHRLCCWISQAAMRLVHHKNVEPPGNRRSIELSGKRVLNLISRWNLFPRRSALLEELNGSIIGHLSLRQRWNLGFRRSTKVRRWNQFFHVHAIR